MPSRQLIPGPPGQARTSVALGANDPRNRRNPAAQASSLQTARALRDSTVAAVNEGLPLTDAILWARIQELERFCNDLKARLVEANLMEEAR